MGEARGRGESHGCLALLNTLCVIFVIFTVGALLPPVYQLEISNICTTVPNAQTFEPKSS